MDRYAANDSILSSARRGMVITPDDNAALANVPKALYVGTGGDITMIGVDAASEATGLLFKSVPSGTILPFCPRRVLATGTTASNIIGLI